MRAINRDTYLRRRDIDLKIISALSSEEEIVQLTVQELVEVINDPRISIETIHPHCTRLHTRKILTFNSSDLTYQLAL